MPESLIAAIDELTAEYESAKADPAFQAEFTRLLHSYAGRPSPITEVARSTEEFTSLRKGWKSVKTRYVRLRIDHAASILHLSRVRIFP